MVITTGASQNTIGLPGTAGVNVISGNAITGVEIIGAGANTVENNFVGCNSSGSALLLNQPAQPDGIVIVNTPNTMVGGDSFALDGNLISGNLQIGIFIVGSGSVGTQIVNNAIGTDATISKKLGNAQGGLALGSNGRPGVPTNSVITGNVIAGNTGFGIGLFDGTSGNLITGNSVGTNVEQITIIGNTGFGITINNSPNNTIGGTGALANQIDYTSQSPGATTAIQGGSGINLTGSGCTGNSIRSNAIVSNSTFGVLIQQGASGNIISNGNVIDLNLTGINITGAGTSNNVVRGDLIGLDANDQTFGNSATGITIDGGASGNIIGGTSNAFNLISANSIYGVFITGQSNGNLVRGNGIGTNIFGSFASGYGNTQAGIFIEGSSNNTIGAAGLTFANPNITASNMIVGNGIGIGIDGNSQNNVVLASTIASSQGFNLPDIGSSEGYGIDITNNASNNHIGGPDTVDSNTITANVGPGVYVASGTADAILGNSIYGNAGLGIDLAPRRPQPQPTATDAI